MKEHPIIFSAEMVRAILEGRKTQTRRPIKPQLPTEPLKEPGKKWGNAYPYDGFYYCGVKCPYGKPGDQLWVRESFAYLTPHMKKLYGFLKSSESAEYRADITGKPSKNSLIHGKWRPSIYMPRWASRITLEITDIRVERIQDISEADCYREGCGHPHTRDLKKPKFKKIWNSIYETKGYGWNKNPWVWVIEFRRTQ